MLSSPKLVFYHVGPAGGSAPRPTVVAGLGAGAEVVEGDKLLRQVVLIGRDCLSKQRQSGIAITARTLPRDLVVGAVFLEDVDYGVACPRALRS